MPPPAPSPSALRALRQTLSSSSPSSQSLTHPHHCTHPTTFSQVRHATLLRRPKRPYTFTQLITLSDGSTFLHRTTNPAPVYKSTKDTRNTALWNPSSHKLLNVEEDEAGKLAAFRAKFGRGWDVEGAQEQTTDDGQPAEQTDYMLDLISGKDRKETKKVSSAAASKAAAKAKAKSGKK
ncbi:hypothetical protein K491DRAFT_690692 [Lophiostoma macrostomum CBS 122681]|uniref:Ribosomal protein bL31m N-terminal domain-containing protein n=1 Tax=Lophiostoma macrostomum CBS 122681 TaxID=1314788 RepID=A0A6A6TDN7_9PLEO|nr:hypothetical protein K491DRAFT_690692 [Lophiostoma macrostomum CBS 122681]